MVGLSIAGVIWYQGESNAQRAAEYRTLLPTMIRAWRERWNQGDFPFLIVQLANFGQTDSVDKSDWAELREAQHQVASTEPHCGLACALDLGHPTDIHPRNKRDVGIRLAHEAMRVAYGKKDAPRSPTYASHKIIDRSVEITFEHAEQGLATTGVALGFHVAGDDRVFKPARATISGSRVIVTSDDVEKPVAVRYAWRGDPEHNLRSANGLPVLPFRTDRW
jgi:sialate O-acetylesterase